MVKTLFAGIVIAIAAASGMLPGSSAEGLQAPVQAPAQSQQFGAQRATPPRDQTQPADKGTSGLKGRIVDGASGKPLRRASISITSIEPAGVRKSISTGLDGTYEFKDLPAASYKVSVTRGGYLSLEYGQRRPGELGQPIDVAAHETVDKVDFALPRMGIITGHVTDERGDPIEDVTVLAMRSIYFNGRRQLVPMVGTVVTDDAGEYRLRKLPPGSYYLMATTKETWKSVENGKDVLLGYLPTYFPGVPTVSEARRITVGIGQQISGMDLGLLTGRAARVSGRALDSQGRPFGEVNLSQEIRGDGFSSFRGGPSGHVSPDGSFSIPDVPPGDYVASAARMGVDEAPEVAEAPITVDGADIESLALTGSGGGSVSGRVVTDDEGLKLDGLRIIVGPVIQGQASPAVLGAFRNGGGFTTAKEDGSFAVDHVWGLSRVRVTLPSGWSVKSITHDGRDITDGAFQLGSGEAWNDVEIRVTKRSASISGAILDPQQAPVTTGTVIVFAADAQRWFESSRFVRAARPNQQGQWHVVGLPEGDYLVAAVDYVENGGWNDPDYLATLRDAATRVHLDEGASQTVQLKIVTPR